MKKAAIIILLILLLLYILVCVLLYIFQEKIIFHPKKLNKTYRFNFDQNFKEMNIRTEDGILLNGLLFSSDSTKGLIFYLHGNGGCLSSWGDVAKIYTRLHYDVFMLDYRGYGKSEGAINSQQQMFNDMQAFYNELRKRYTEDKIIILGHSIGTGPASKIASENNPRLLILQTPYFSLPDMMRRTFPIIPTFILKYKFETYKYVSECKMPIVIFHGDADEVIYYGSSLKLKEQFKPQDTLITLKGQGHNQITENKEYKEEIKKILAK